MKSDYIKILYEVAPFVKSLKRKNMERVILHIDLNCFYASAEMMLNPALRGKAVVVCGSTHSRHGIVLAKSELAKKRGVKTGMVNWEPSHHEKVRQLWDTNNWRHRQHLAGFS